MGSRFQGKMPLMQQATATIGLQPDIEHVTSVTMDAQSSGIDPKTRFPHYKDIRCHMIEKDDLAFTVRRDRNSSSNGSGPVRSSLCGMDIGGAQRREEVEAMIDVIGPADTHLDFAEPFSYGLTAKVQGTGSFAQNPTGIALARGDLLCWRVPNFAFDGDAIRVAPEEYTHSEEWYRNLNKHPTTKLQLGLRRQNGIKGKLPLKIEKYERTIDDKASMGYYFDHATELLKENKMPFDKVKLFSAMEALNTHLRSMLDRAVRSKQAPSAYFNDQLYKTEEKKTKELELAMLEHQVDALNFDKRRIFAMVLSPATSDSQVDYMMLR